MELFNTFTLLVSTSFLLIWFWLKNNYNFWKKRNIESSHYEYFWGSMKEVFLQKDTFSDSTRKIYREFKDKGARHGGLFFLWVPLYMPIDIEIVKSIIQVDFQHFVNRGIYVNEKADPLSAHLFSLQGKKWKLLRNKLTPTFTSGKIRMMFETLVDCTKGLEKLMDKEMGKSVDIKDILGRFTTDVIGSCAFGLNCNSLEDPKSEFRVRGKSLFEKELGRSIKDAILFLLPNLMKKLNMKMIPEDISNFFMTVVKDTVEYREKNNISRKDFMDLLIQLKNKGKLVDDDQIGTEQITEAENYITLDEICAQAFIFFEAGFETSSTAMTFCLYELAKNKEIQKKAREEMRIVLSRHEGKLTYDAAMEMHYVEQVINETLRKYPPGPILNRICTKEYKVPNTDIVLEKGIRVMIPVMGIHRDPEHYPDPEKFDPERFSEENKRNIKPFTFLPFGEGPRVCIGVRFGMMQAKVGLTALLLNYDFDMSEDTKEPLEFDPRSFILLTKGGIWLKYRRTENKYTEL
ncbi:probable cytochrome P450 6a14 [Harmonia axyridis]|uniref:probable cytochrome P450 6a14 n=1 Tax=Harmonia axyridis TaxID=115357 RepID=UPI001E276FEB|nr:probable cytochrome P450 6a14 [Harmonia axyridis]XP_045483363.1 probable cytochrome P450 6a14 [Harmonia axyridis]